LIYAIWPGKFALFLWQIFRSLPIFRCMRKRNIALAAVSVLILQLTASNARAIPASEIISFGDSLTDAGNASIATSGAFPGANYATRTVPGVPFPVGYYTDGPSTTPATSGPTGLWIDQLAADLGVTDPVPALAPGGGTNYAVGGALTGSASPQDMQNQVNLFLSQHLSGAPSTALYTFWGGANDVLAGDSPATAANNIYEEIKELSADGGKTFLWPNLPLLGDTPEGSANAAALNAATTGFNTQWSADLATLKSDGVNVIGVDVASLFSQIVASPSTYGFKYVTSPAQGVTAANPNDYLFWDDLHPTTEADMDVANLALADLNSVPEPASSGVLVVLGLGVMGRRRRQAS
jgi:phospholipase/lecithinase/hemolysin